MLTLTGAILSLVSLLGLTPQSLDLSIGRQLKGSTTALVIESATALSRQEQVNSGLPVRLKIPKINVDIALEYVGITSQGAVDVPKDPVNAAWFNLGPRPGEIGNAVIDGHSGWKNGIRVAFDNLYKLQKGDRVYVEDDKGVVTSFVVRESKKYDPHADTADVFSSNDGKSYLNLITCEGIWDKVSKSYSKRLVVFTDKE